MTRLGILKAAGALGLLIGTAAAVGLILLFVAASLTHLRARLLVRSSGCVSPAGRGRAGAGTACQGPRGVGASDGVGGIVGLQLIRNEVNMTFYSLVQFIDLTALVSDALVRSK